MGDKGRLPGRGAPTCPDSCLIAGLLGEYHPRLTIFCAERLHFYPLWWKSRRLGETIFAGQQKGAGIAASPHVTGLRLLGPEGHLGLVSAACSARAGKGMRASRRSSRAGLFRLPKERLFPEPRRPASVSPGATLKPCLDTISRPIPQTSDRFRRPPSSWHPVRLAPSLPPGVSALLSQPFRTRPIGASWTVISWVARGLPTHFRPRKFLALLWFPSAPPPSYSYEPVIESARWEA